MRLAPLRRFCVSSSQAAFSARNRKIAAFLKRFDSAEAETTFASALTPEQKEFVDLVHQTYFLSLDEEESQQFLAMVMHKKAPVLKASHFFVPFGCTEDQAAEISEDLVPQLEKQLQFNELVKKELEGLSLSAAPAAASSAPAPTEAAPEAPKQEVDPTKKKYKIEITSVDAAKKLALIKEVKAILNLGLKEAKDLVDKAPSVVAKDTAYEDMEKIKEKLSAAGAVLTIT